MLETVQSVLPASRTVAVAEPIPSVTALLHRDGLAGDAGDVGSTATSRAVIAS